MGVVKDQIESHPEDAPEVVLIRRHGVSQGSQVAYSMSVVSGAGAGATALTFDVQASGRRQPLAGKVWAQTVFALAGTDYTVSADADVASNQLVVTFSPGLVAPVSAGDIATFSDTRHDTLAAGVRIAGRKVRGIVSDWSNQQRALLRSGGLNLLLPAEGLPFLPGEQDKVEVVAYGRTLRGVVVGNGFVGADHRLEVSTS